jgi:iron uptake system EfeUOB component EfeO/EfeM
MTGVSNGKIRLATRAALIGSALLMISMLAVSPAGAASLAEGAKNYKSFAVERIGNALTGAKEMQAAVKAGDVKAAQGAWLKSRKGWESAEPITGEFFPKLDEVIDAWPDAKQGYHAIEAALFAGKLAEIKAPVNQLVANLAEFDKQLGAPSFQFEPQGLLNGTTKLAYEVGENKSKGGESPYAGSSLNDMKDNVRGIQALYQIAFEDTLQEKKEPLASSILDKIHEVKGLLKVSDLKHLDQPALKKSSEELAVLFQNAAAELGLKKPAVGE